MIAQCPKCKSIFDIDDALIPPKGRHARCSVCRERFYISPPSSQKPSPSQPLPSPVIKADAVEISNNQAPIPQKKHGPTSPAKPPVTSKRKSHSSFDELKLTRYQRIYKRLAAYYINKDNGYKYEISVFCFAYKQIPSPRAMAREVDRLRKMIEQSQKDLKQFRSPEDDRDIKRLEDEINRHGGLIKIFGDLVKFQKEFKAKGLDVSVNQILAVLKDVEVAVTAR